MDTLSLFSLKGKTALITGSGSGIGLALAEGLAGAGAKITLNGRTVSKLENAENKLQQQGFKVDKLVFDVTDLKMVKKAITGYEKTKDAIDILINNAGINIRGPFEKLNEEDWNKVLNTNTV